MPEIPQAGNQHEKSPELLTEDTLAKMIENGGCNDRETMKRVDEALKMNPALLMSDSLEKIIGVRLQVLVVNAMAAKNKEEIAYLSNLFARVQDARRQTDSSSRRI